MALQYTYLNHRHVDKSAFDVLFFIAKNALCTVYIGLPSENKRCVNGFHWLCLQSLNYWVFLWPTTMQTWPRWTVWTWHLSNIIVGTWHLSNIIVGTWRLSNIIVWTWHLSNLVVRTWHSSNIIVCRSHRSKNTYDFSVSNSSFEGLDLRMLFISALWLIFFILVITVIQIVQKVSENYL